VTRSYPSQEYSTGNSATRYNGTSYGTGTSTGSSPHYSNTQQQLNREKICEECINCIGSLAYKIRQTLHCRKLLLARFSKNLSIEPQAKEDITSS
jgi:hypothetical protein